MTRTLAMIEAWIAALALATGCRSSSDSSGADVNADGAAKGYAAQDSTIGGDGLTGDVASSPDALGANSAADAPTGESADTAADAQGDASSIVESGNDGANADVTVDSAYPDAPGDGAIGSSCRGATDCARVLTSLRRSQRNRFVLPRRHRLRGSPWLCVVFVSVAEELWHTV